MQAIQPADKPFEVCFRCLFRIILGVHFYRKGIYLDPTKAKEIRDIELPNLYGEGLLRA